MATEPDAELLTDGEEVPQMRRFYTPAEVTQHNTRKSCWLSWFGKVYNLTPLIEEYDEG